MKTPDPARRCVLLLVPRRRRLGASARQFHDQPLRARRGRRTPAVRALRRGHGRDPDAPARADSDPRHSQAVRRRAARHPAGREDGARASRSGAAGLRTTRFQAILAGPQIEHAASIVGRRSQLRRPDRLEGDRARRDHPLDLRRAPRVPEGSAAEPARRDARPAAARPDTATRRRRCSVGQRARGAGPRRRFAASPR